MWLLAKIKSLFVHYGLFKLNQHLVQFSKCKEEDVIDFNSLNISLRFNELSSLYTIAIILMLTNVLTDFQTSIIINCSTIIFFLV